MPSFIVPFAIATTGVIALRAIYNSGDNFLHQMLDRVVNFFSNIFHFTHSGTEPGREYAQQEMKDIEKERDERLKDLHNGREKDIEGHKEEMRTEAPFSEREEQMERKERDEITNRFVPARWRTLNENEKEYAVKKLASIISIDMGLSQKYNVSLESGDTRIDSENLKIIVSKELMESNQWDASIRLYNGITKNVAYARQNEVLAGLVTPTSMENKLNDTIKKCMKPEKSYVNMPKMYFLNGKIYPMERKEASPYITAKENSSMERRFLEILQPSERIPNMMTSMYYEQLQEKILDQEDPKIGKKELSYMEFLLNSSYQNVKDEMTKLYGLEGRRNTIEDEIDKILLYNADQNPLKEEPKWLNRQIQLSVGIAQLQTYAEERGQRFTDPRNKILEKTGDTIDKMSDKYYSKNRGLLDYYGIKVNQVVPHDEWEKENKGNKGNGHDNTKNTKETNGTPEESNKENEQNDNQEPNANQDNNGKEQNNDTSVNEKDNISTPLEEENISDEEWASIMTSFIDAENNTIEDIPFESSGYEPYDENYTYEDEGYTYEDEGYTYQDEGYTYGFESDELPEGYFDDPENLESVLPQEEEEIDI